MHIGFWYENVKERDYLEDPSVIFKTGVKIGWKCVDWIHLAQDSNK
jgi:hypothetical protein